MNTIGAALGKSALLHIGLVVILGTSMHFAPPKTPDPVANDLSSIEAVTVDQASLEKQLQQIRNQNLAKQQAEEKRVRELEQRAAEAQKRRKQEEVRIKNLEQSKKRKEEEKRKADQAAADARKKQKKEKERAQKLEQERLRKEKERKAAEKKAKEAKEKREREEKALKEAERKKREAQEKAEQERLMEEQLQKEQAARNKRRQQVVLSEVGKYQALIKQKIQRNWRQQEFMKGKYCRLNLRLASNGLVTQITVLEGDEIVCQSAQTAIYKIDTLPVSSEPDVFEEMKSINLTLGDRE